MAPSNMLNMEAPFLSARQYADRCPDGAIYSRGRCYTRWSYYGRWILLGIFILFCILVFFILACINARRRRKRGLRPMYGMGWVGGNTGNAQHNNAHAYNNYHQPPPAYGAPQGPSYPMHSQHPSNGYYGQQDGVQQPKNAYAPAGANDYAPPPGPPPPDRP
ncbi:hypothetical protein DL770_008919 [Monosporascus sp. CRB-9-2]|nr:hypothetical protein DL770_008919 [Monosporascus sp. CRB-9-2]